MSEKSFTPLPTTLSGVTLTRPIKIDQSLMYLIGGALEWLCDKEPLEQTGTLTIDDTKNALSEMLWAFYNESAAMIPAGTVLEYAGGLPLSDVAIEQGWLVCDGSLLVRADYPALFDAIGTLYNLGGEASTDFRLPDYADRSTFGAGSVVGIGIKSGEISHTLTLAEMPVHDHPTDVAGASFVNRASGGASYFAPGTSGTVTLVATTGNAGGGNAHSILHPVIGVNKIIMSR